MPLPDFIIAGETKCGTTSMYNNLIQHSKIYPSLGNGDIKLTDDGEQLSIKELRFFDRYYHLGWDWYKNRFPLCPEDCITGEATPMYLYRTQAIKRMSDIMPDCKIIVMFRDPVKRLISHYRHLYNISNNWRTLYPTFDIFWNTAHENDYYLIDKGLYWQTLKRLYQYYPSSQVKVIISEELFKIPQEIYRDTLEFLDLEYQKLEPNYSRKNKNKTIITELSEIKDFYKVPNFLLGEMLGRELPWGSH